MNSYADSQSQPELPVAQEQGNSKRLLFIVDLGSAQQSNRVLRDGLFRALELCRSQHEISLACLYRDAHERELLNQFLDAEEQARIKIHLVEKDICQLAPGMMSQACLNSYTIFEWLKANGELFDIVQAYDADNCLYFSMLSKKLGLHFTGLAFLIICSSPRLLASDIQQTPIDSFIDLAGIFMERQSFEMADHILAGSDCLLQWLSQQGHTSLGDKCQVLAPLVAEKYCRVPVADETGSTRYFTVLGDLQPGPDLLFYLDSFSRLIRAADSEKIDPANVKFRFICDRPAAKPSLRLISNLFRQAGYEWQVIQSDLFEYLSSNQFHDSCFLVPPRQIGPGLLEISMLAQGKYFIGFKKSGLDALLDNSSVKGLIRAHPHDVFCNMLRWLSGKAEPLKSGHSNPARRENYDQWYRNLTCSNNQMADVEFSDLLISICVAHYNRPVDLGKALDSISRQNYRNIEVIVVDDGSTLPEAIEYLRGLERMKYPFPIRVYYQPNLYLGASRNLAASHANGKYLLFMDDDNLTKPNEVELLLRVAEYADADILTCFADAFVEDGDIDKGEGGNRIVFSGPDIASGLFRNPYGDSNCFVRKSSFDDLGGFTEDYKIGRDDQEFFSRAVLKGYRLFVVPEALYWYKINTSRMRQTQFSQYAGLHRVARAYINESGLDPHWLDIMRYAQGLAALRYGVTGKGLSRFTQNNRLRLLAYRYPKLYKWLLPLMRKLL